MRYYKGFPEEVKIGDGKMTLHDVERNMLSLYWDEKLNESDKDFLMRQYKRERMRYLDETFQLTADKTQILKGVETLWQEAQKRMETTKKRLVEREVEKMKQGKLAARCVRLFLEIGNLEDAEEVNYSDEENDLWGILCGEDRRHDLFWGITWTSEDIATYEQRKDWENSHKPQHVKKEQTANSTPETFGKDFLGIKERYLLAWSDISRITRFDLTVHMCY